MKRRRKSNMSTGAKVALAIGAVALVPVVLAGFGISWVVRKGKAIDEVVKDELEEA